MRSLNEYFEKYRRLAELYKWRGNSYLLALKTWNMHHELKEILVDPTRYEEAVEEMMRRGDEWDKISNTLTT